MFEENTLALIFVSLMGFSILLYAILDGYDLGVGIMLPLDQTDNADTMIASIGPFWDANETWLVLAIGLLLIAFPAAHSYIFKELYLPTAVLLISLVLRGVAFDFRAKAAFGHKPTWNKVFKTGSLLASLSQGYMLGMYVMGFESTVAAYFFSVLSAFGVAAAYSYIGACWLIMKTEGELQIQAVAWAKKSGLICFIGIIAVSFVNPLINPGVYEKWFTWPNTLLVLTLPIICFALFIFSLIQLKQLPKMNDKGCWRPFVAAVIIFTLCFFGLAFSFFPYIVPNKLTIWETAAAPESLSFLLWGTLIVVPVIFSYTAFSYRVFWGKVRELRYY
ncbi:cytochrome d ubiquinol oxidase subunit II [Colwellia hornerae]|uniref:Cytochrome d ubiquinol oxidase subunit II n=1 Tax=Colwellia hornerae TaxID=89402 RepID=A0A5C6Q8M1_9GAMM|nr:cytochrome d ubiquinol oxidase subunit II [Colwellia hornerae]TWX50212.1 cytochrome d ubiquinol oxidase subunit II [Colwellia hornerae]TWX56109.1 cytochrome d ubiquinol oxidase subunit II [Colwellia hornerae]TWX65131.1 cytochrome d ubiquinol oxidase subunit II [Colwellia hornerae]